MAKKNKAERRFGQLPLPSGHRTYRSAKLNWIGLNKRQTVNSGEPSYEENMSTAEYPYMVPCEEREEITNAMLGDVPNGADFCPLGLWAGGDALITIYGNSSTKDNETTYGIYAQIIMLDENGGIRCGCDGEGDYKAVFRALVTKCSDEDEYDRACKVSRNVVLFNKYDNNANVTDGSYSKKIIILPDKKTTDFNFYDYDALVNKYTDTNGEEAKPTSMDAAKEAGIIGTNGIYYIKTTYETNDLPKFMYYRWDNGENKYVCLNVESTYNDSYFKMDDLVTYDPVAYYNDGYVKCKKGDHAVLGTDYYKRINAEAPYEYKKVVGLTIASESEDGTKIDGSDVEGYYTYDDDLSPGGEASELGKNELKADMYYFNTYESMIYLFVKSDSGSVEIGGKKGDFKISSICSFPDINYAVVHQSRLFGVGEDRIYVSGFNDYANWNYDTINESYAGNAWTTTAQANTKAGGKFTGISVFDNHVCCFKSDFMHEIYNNQNPFRLVDIGAIGTIDNRSIQEVNGRLIFVAEDGVKMYTGSTPREIGTNLGIDRFTEAIAGSDGRNYYLSCEGDGGKHLFVYDTQIGAWSEQNCGSSLAVGFAKADNGMYMLTDDGKLYKLDTGVYVSYDSEGNKVESAVQWSFETDLTTGTTSSTGRMSVDIKHIRKIQFLAEVGEDAEFKVYILCDDEKLEYADEEKKTLKNPWQLAYTSTVKEGMIPVRIKPRKTAHYGYKLRFEGSGYVKIHELEVHIRQGGELYESE